MTKEYEQEMEEFLILPFFKEKLPYEIVYDHKGNLYAIAFFYNQEYDFFAADLYRLENGEKKIIAFGEKMMLNQVLFEIQAELDPDIPVIVPVSFYENIERISWDNMGKEVELVVME